MEAAWQGRGKGLVPRKHSGTIRGGASWLDGGSSWDMLHWGECFWVESLWVWGMLEEEWGAPGAACL